MKMFQSSFEQLLKCFKTSTGDLKKEIRDMITNARVKTDKILVWKAHDPKFTHDAVEMAYVQFWGSDTGKVKDLGIKSVDNTCYILKRYTFMEYSNSILQAEPAFTEYVSPEALVADVESVNIYNLFDVTDNEMLNDYLYKGIIPPFDKLWEIVTQPRSFTIVHREHLVTTFEVDNVTTFEEAMDEYCYRAGNSEYDYSDMEMVDSSDDPVPDDKYEEYQECCVSEGTVNILINKGE